MDVLTVQTPLCALAISASDTAIVSLEFCARENRGDSPLLRLAAQELSAYFARRLRVFTVPLALDASPFFTQVYRAIREIPYGEVYSYAAVAAAAGSPRACRAVGNAVHQNPLPIFVPCHRVVAAHGIGGYAPGLAYKRALLELESANGKGFALVE